MNIAAKIDEQGKWAWIALMVVGFIIFWPIGLALLFYIMWSGRMGCWKHGRVGHRHGPGRWHGLSGRSSGNTAFDEYKAETLRRLEDEQKEFVDFLDRLRAAKDKAEFDQFMAERRNRPAEPESGSDEPPAAPSGPTGPASPAPQPQA
jgi:hypothetical protein